MHYTIAGEIAQFARLESAPGENVWLSKGAPDGLFRWRALATTPPRQPEWRGPAYTRQ